MPLIHPGQIPYVVAFLASGVLSIGFARWVFENYDARGTKTFGYVFVFVGLWATTSASSVVLTGPIVTHLLLSTQMVLLVATSRLWFIFASQYTNRSIHRDRRVQVALSAFVAAAFFLPVTNPLHGFVWTDVARVATPFPHYVIGKGPGHFVLTLSSYALVAAGTYFFVVLLWNTRHMRSAIAWLLVGFVALLLSNAIPYVVPLVIRYPPTVTPLGAVAFCVAAANAIRHNLFEVRPIAREAILEDMREPILTLDRNRRILAVNDAFLTQFADDRVTEESVVHREFDGEFPDLAARLDLNTEEPISLTVAGSGPERHHYAVTVSPLHSGPHLLGHSLLFKDVTQVTESKLELERQNAQLDEFADSAAHDLRNPLTVVEGFSEVLDTHLSAVAAGEATFDSHLVDNALVRIRSNAAQMDEIITDFLRVTRASKSLSRLEPVDFSAVVDEAVSSLDPEEEITVKIRHGGRIYADQDRLTTILRTILRSADHRRTPEMVVEAYLTDDGFVVEDTGETIPPDQADVLLTYGYTTAYRGRGLGLSVAKTLAEVHRWDIRIDTTYRRGVRIVVSGADAEPSADVRISQSDTL
ncbi:MAG: histidine kinase N-terminal 7TM domain-containing protein [Salinigranum sp.]